MDSKHPPIITLTCDYCGRKYEQRRSYHKHKVGKRGITANFCSYDCKSKAQRTELPESIDQMYQQGDSLAKIGRRFGVCGNTIRKRLSEMGVEIRSRTWHLNTDKNPTKGKGHSEETKKLLRQRTIEQFQSEEARMQAKHNQINAMASGKVVSTSELENTVANLLDDMGIAYKRQKPLRDPETGRFFACVDFLLDDGNVLEVNGSFWHADPRLFPDGPEHDCQFKTVANDKERKAKMQELGIPIVEVWGLDVRDDLDSVRAAIENR